MSLWPSHDLASKQRLRFSPCPTIGGPLIGLCANTAKAVSSLVSQVGSRIDSRNRAAAVPFSTGPGATRSKLSGKDEIKWQELLSRK